jgi:hypothetical protein
MAVFLLIGFDREMRPVQLCAEVRTWQLCSQVNDPLVGAMHPRAAETASNGIRKIALSAAGSRIVPLQARCRRRRRARIF